MKVKKLRELRREDYALIVTILLVIFVVVRVFMIHHVPMKVHYDKEAKELVISPGWFYTLEEYSIYTYSIYDDTQNALFPLSVPSDPVYRFRPVLDNPSAMAMEEFWIYYRDNLTGEISVTRLTVERSRIYGSDYLDFSIGGSGAYVRFSLYPEE